VFLSKSREEYLDPINRKEQEKRGSSVFGNFIICILHHL
jgi:hypothetical protein